MNRKPPVSAPLMVSDHAVLRYMERVLGFNIDGVRAQIRELTEPAYGVGASGVKKDGFYYPIVQGVVTSCVPNRGPGKETIRRMENGDA
jgi:hypothetical protein